MKLRTLALVILMLAAAIGAGAASMTATAETNETNETVDNATNATDEIDGPPSESSQENIRVDESVTVTAYEWDADNNVFRVTFENDGRPTQITVTESVQRAEGAGTFSITQERLLPGTNEITLNVEPAGGQAAVSITTSASIDAGSGVYLSTGITESSRPSITWDTAQILIGLTALGTGVGITRVVRKKRDEETKEAERWI